MAVISHGEKRFRAQVVYAGPGLSGKTTNLRRLSEWLPNTPMTEFETENERTTFYDELPVELPLHEGSDWSVVFKIQTVPGQVQYRASREMVLRNPDAVVFVADSDPRRMDANRYALDELTRILEGGTRALSEIPLVLQYNKVDVEGALSMDEMNRMLNPGGAPVVEAFALKGVGVIETLAVALDLAVAKIAEEYPMAAAGGTR